MAQYTSSNEREEPTTKNTLPVRLRFRFDRDVKSFTEKQKLRELSTPRPALQLTLEELLGGKNKKRPQLGTGKLHMEKLTSKGKHTI